MQKSGKRAIFQGPLKKLPKQPTALFCVKLDNLRKFKQLSPEDRKLFLEAWLTLGLMRTAILVLSFKRLTRSLKMEQSDISVPESDDRVRDTAFLIGRAINRAAGHTPWESACLIRALTAQRMLNKRGLPGKLYLGIKKNRQEMTAHAWTLCGNKFVTGQSGHKEYTPISAFTWGCCTDRHTTASPPSGRKQ